MPKYIVTGTVSKTYVAVEEGIKIIIEAADEDEARDLADRELCSAAQIYSCDAEHESTDLEHIESIEIIPGTEDEDMPIPRCPNTLDMFAPLAA